MLIELAIVFVTLLAPALGGATNLLAQAVIVLAAGILITAFPPKHSPPALLVWAALILIAFASLSFLPVTWLPLPPLREMFSSVQILMPRTFSMQPWVSCEHLMLLIAGLVWALYLSARNWVRSRQMLLQLYASGIVLLSTAATICFVVDWRPKLWHSEANSFGFFPNPDQTGIVLGTGGVLLMALAVGEFARSKARGNLWLLGYALNLAALVLNGSRKGLLIHFLGLVLWSSRMMWLQRKTDSARRWQLGAATSAAALAIMLLAFNNFSGDGNSTAPANARGASDLARRVQVDALKLFRGASWHGIGLGNFEPIFAHYRNQSKGENRVIHPENDWLWAGIELGWFAPVLVLGALVCYLVAQRPRAVEPDAALRCAILTCVALFLIYGFVTVSGHRMGAVWPALLLLAVMRRRPEAPSERRLPRMLFRVLGLGLLAIGLWWFASAHGRNIGLTSATAGQLKREMFSALQADDFARAIRLADQGLHYSPLDWQWHFGRGLAQMNSPAMFAEALNNFHRARVLEPNSPQTPFAEAKAWLTRAPILAFQAWQETLRRAPVGERTNYFQAMLELGKGIPEVEHELFSLAATDRELLLVFMAFVGPKEFQEELDKLLLDDPALASLSTEQKQRLFALWSAKGDRALLETKLRENPSWQTSVTPSSPLSPQGKAP